MCGITGLWEKASTPGSDSEIIRTAVSMRDSLRHRGPDDSGVWSNGAGLALAHRRLSIQDISEHGHQPMLSNCGRFVIVFNGEIYNFPTLRDELKQAGHTFCGHSDTEVLLAAVVQWGLEQALSRFNGMFALALWDKRANTLSDSSTPMNTFSIGFEGEKNSEADAARRIASHLGTNHHELVLNGQAALDAIPGLHDVNDEPLGDPSQIPTCLVSELASNSVTVAFTGDGGDELFYGYKRYLSSSQIWSSFQNIPAPLRSTLARLIDVIADCGTSQRKLRSHADTLRAEHSLDVYTRRMAKFANPEQLMKTDCRADLSQCRHVRELDLQDTEFDMMLLDFVTYLTDNILVKVDRASMQHGLEMRNPLLDVTVIECAWRLPQAFKHNGHRGKHILRDVLARYVPDTLTNRPKQGFSPPLTTWLHGPLREWADSLLEPSRLDREGIFDGKVVDQLWRNCKKHQGKGLSRIWTVLMFQVWHEGNMSVRKG